jgi:hypothetical protein
MSKVEDIQQEIFHVEGLFVEFTTIGNILPDYYRRRTDGSKNVTQFIRDRLKKRYPDSDIRVHDGVGDVANGNYKISNLRLTYSHQWIREHWNSLLDLLNDEFELNKRMKRRIRGLKRELAAAENRDVSDSVEMDPYDVLQIETTATVDEIKAALQEKRRKNHPDFIDSMDTKIKEFANERMKEINLAYDQIKKERGMDV